jgi:hypothetical protein
MSVELPIIKTFSCALSCREHQLVKSFLTQLLDVPYS